MKSLLIKCFLLFGALISWYCGDNAKMQPLQNTIITDVCIPVEVCQGNFQCTQQRLSESLNIFSNFSLPLRVAMSVVKRTI